MLIISRRLYNLPLLSTNDCHGIGGQHHIFRSLVGGSLNSGVDDSAGVSVGFCGCGSGVIRRRWLHVNSNPIYIVTQLNQIAYSHMFQNESLKSVAVFNKSLEICQTYTPHSFFMTNEELSGLPERQEKRVLPSKYMLWTLVALSEAYLRLNNIEEGNKCLDVAHLIAQRTYSETDDRKLNFLLKLAIFYYKSGQKQLAKETFHSILRFSQQKYAHLSGTLKHHSCRCNYYLGMMEIEQNNFEKAKQLLELSWKQHRSVLGVNHYHTISVMVPLAKVYLEVGNYVEARKLVEYAAQHYVSHHREDPIPELIELHKAIIKNIPGAVGLLKHLPIATRNGFKERPVPGSNE